MPKPTAPSRRRPDETFGHPQIITLAADRQQDARAAGVNREILNDVAGRNVEGDGAEPRAARHREDVNRLAILVEHVEHTPALAVPGGARSEEHTSELQSQSNLVC